MEQGKKGYNGKSIGKNPLDNSIELVKEFKVDGTNYVKVALRISNSGVLFAKLNSSKFLYQLSKGDYLEIQK